MPAGKTTECRYTVAKIEACADGRYLLNKWHGKKEYLRANTRHCARDGNDDVAFLNDMMGVAKCMRLIVTDSSLERQASVIAEDDMIKHVGRLCRIIIERALEYDFLRSPMVAQLKTL